MTFSLRNCEDDAPFITCEALKRSTELFTEKQLAQLRDARERTPISHPGIGPVEVCARCQGPVDMTRFHLTYLASAALNEGFSMRSLEIDYLAVVCDQCSGITAPQATNVFEATTSS